LSFKDKVKQIESKVISVDISTKIYKAKIARYSFGSSVIEIMKNYSKKDWTPLK
jgi:hypothetical protein